MSANWLLKLSEVKKMNENRTLLIQENEIVSLIQKVGLEKFMKKLEVKLERGFKMFADKKIKVPARHEFYFDHGSVESMPAASSDYFGIKIVNTHPENSQKFGIPTIIACGILVDGRNGFPLLITESTILTAIRTAIASAVATKYLSRVDSKIVGIIGTGAQAIHQIHAISLIRNIESVYAFDIDRSALNLFLSTCRKIGFHAEEKSPEELCKISDIIITATCKEKYTEPIVYNAWVREGTHINAVGGDSPGKFEIEKALLLKSKIVVDFIDQAIIEGETQQIDKTKIYAHLGEIVAKRKIGRENSKEITIFDSTGFAMEDLITYEFVFDLAKEIGIGREIDLIIKPKNPKNLYESYFIGEKNE